MKFVKLSALVVSGALTMGIMAGCAAQEQQTSTETKSQEATQTQTTEQSSTPEVKELQMQYISQDDAAAKLNDDGYVFLDLRKAADYEQGHIPGAISADMDAAKGGDAQSGITNMTKALEEKTNSATGADKKLVLICYSGKSYAQAGTNILGAMGADMNNVYTLEGGMKAYTGEQEK